MYLDLDLYRKELRLPGNPPVTLSAIDISPDQPRHTLVFLHGFAGRAMQWVYQMRQFSTENRVIAINMRGHGQSDKPSAGYSMTQLTTDLEMALELLQVKEPIILVSHSFGGAIAIEYACSHPERLAGMVLIAAAARYHLNPLYRFALRLPLQVLRVVRPFVRNQLSAPPHVLKAWYVNILSNWDGTQLFPRLQVPTLVIRGHLDIVLERPMFEQVARSIPNAEEVDVGASGHMVMLERREAVNRAIERFITNLSGQTQGKRAWRENGRTSRDVAARQTSSRAALVRERPWLSHYDDGVPYTVAFPRVPIQDLLASVNRRFPHHTALIFEGSRITYQRLHQESNRFANALLSLGLHRGDRVMIFLPNIPQFVVAYFGTLKAGGVAVFTLPTTQPEELIRQIEDCEARVLVTLEQYADLARRAMRGALQAVPVEDMELEAGIAPGHHIVITDAYEYLPSAKRMAARIGGAPAATPPPRTVELLDAEEHSFPDLLKEHGEAAPDVRLAADALAVIIYTGGTTSDPKGVMLSHANLVANAVQTRSWMPSARDGQERFLCVLPFSHSYGLTTTLNMPVAIGATLILQPRFEINSLLQSIKRYRPTIFPGVPNMYIAINDFPGVRRFGISSIQACLSGSAPLPVEVQEAFEKLTRGRLVEGYGLTEASPVTHANPLNGMRKVGSIGVPLPSTEARIVDLQGSQKGVPTGQIGELAVRGPQVMMGYWRDKEATRKAITPEGWLLTGDIAQADEEGYMRIIARKSDMWYTSKPNKPAFPRDVEEVLYEVPQVKEAAVVAIASQPVAFIIARGERPTTDSLIAYCKRRLPPELVPRLVIFLDEFPRTFIGKVLRRELAKRYEES